MEAGQPGYGGQPAGAPGYGQPYSQGYGQPYADPYGGYQQPTGEDLLMQAKEQKRQEKEERKMKRKAADLEAGASAVQTILGVSLINLVLLITAMFGTSWSAKTMVGFGVKNLYIQTDIFTMSVDVTCGKWNAVEEFVCDRFKHIQGKHTLHSAVQNACSLNDLACNTMDYIYWASIVLFTFFFFGVGLLIVGDIFLLFYWYSAPLPKVRQIARNSFVFSMVTVGTGIFMWSFLVPDLDEIPRSWTHGMGLLGGDNGIFSLKETNDFQFGWCWILGIFAVFMLLVQNFLWFYMFIYHPGEEDAVQNEEARAIASADREAAALGWSPAAESAPLMHQQPSQAAYGAGGQPMPAQFQPQQQYPQQYPQQPMPQY